MSRSSRSPSLPLQESEGSDPLNITENDRKQFKESEAIKRKSVTQCESDGSIKKQKTDEEEETKSSDSESDSDGSNDDDGEICESRAVSSRTHDEVLAKPPSVAEDDSDDFDVSEKLKTMSEISVKPISKNERDQVDKQYEETDDKVSIEITKKDTKKDAQERKVQNLRKNIKDVLDDSQLDATTLAAQRQESERLARVQEQQRLIRETQRQIAAERQSNKTQQKVLSLLQGESSDSDPSNSALDLDDPILQKFSLSSAVTITPAAKEALQSIQSLMSTNEQIPDSDEDGDSDDDVILQPDESLDKSKAVVVDSSSDSDDCVILEDAEEEEDIDDDENNCGEHTNDLYNQHDAEGRVAVNIGHGESESNIFIAPQIARVIKPHQIGGVRFLFDNIIESIELFDKSAGFGCILAHSMGLGKTMQAVCFCDIFLRHTHSKKILIIMPINTLQNWLHEFNMWLPLPEDAEKSSLNKDGKIRPRQFKIFVLNDSHKTLHARAKTVFEWSNDGGVLMMGYEMFRLLSLKKMKQKRKKGTLFNAETSSNEEQQLFDKINAALVNPGPDLVLCDEGHRIKNAHASTSLALKQIKTKRRVVLTGYPLQNNLLEYWCMVDFVRPSYLGTKTEFSNMFERPIQNGQCIDSTPKDCRLMRFRAHVLHSLLKGFVQRRSQSVLQKCLPDKTEYVLLVRMTPFQRKLYSVFMDEVVRCKKVPNPLKAFAVCCKIWNHPDVLYNFLKKRELDLDIEVEEAESVTKAESSVAPKKRGRKAKETKKDERKIEAKTENEEEKLTKLDPVKLEPSSASSESFKPPMTPSSNDSAYSSNQSVNSSYDSSSTGYNSYAGYDSAYPNYNSYNNGNGYQNWNGGSNYWQQNNYFQNDYSQNYQPPFYGNSNYQAFDPKPQVLPKMEHNQPYYDNTNYQSFDQNPVLPVLPKIEPAELKIDSVVSLKNDGGLLADVIKEETKELRDRDAKDVTARVDTETKESVVTKSSRDDGIPYEWAVELMKDYVSDLVENSPKMEIFFCILEESIKLGDRLLVFSQSLLTLNVLERFLQRSKIPTTETHWAKNVSYFRLDGSTAALDREKLINEFNANSKVKLFLVSTRAGSLGINLVGANRVVVFDASWNPCHDTQAVCRVYRYGQSKSCFVYRFVMDNCLEKKIYDRQINKQGMADRVVDECNPDAHLSLNEVTSLCYNDGVDPELKDFRAEIENCKDLVAKQILESHSQTLTKEPFQHESLLVDRKETKLSQAEKRMAKRGYEMDKQAQLKASLGYNPVGTNYRAYRTPDGSIVHRPVASVRPMQNEFGDSVSSIHPNTPRPNRWTPVEVWQKKGLTAQEMVLPQDVSIQTNSADKSKIYLKAGQKVIVLKSHKGICLQLESGKVIAIRASMKGGQQAPGVEQKLGSFSGLQNQPQSGSFRPNFPPRNDGDVIDISNDDDEDEGPQVGNAKPIDMSPAVTQTNGVLPPAIQPIQPTATADTVYKEKVVYKPNLVQRKSKMPPPPTPSQEKSSGYQPHLRPTPPKWEERKNYTNSGPSKTSSFSGRNMNGDQKNHTVSVPFLNVNESSRITEELPSNQSSDPSAFHAPPGGGQTVGPFVAPSYPPQNSYQSPSYPPNLNYHSASSSSNYNYSYHHSAAPNAQHSYHYPAQASGSYDPNYPPYQQGYGTNYNQHSSNHSYPPPINSDSTVQVPFTVAPPNYDQWNYNN